MVTQVCQDPKEIRGRKVSLAWWDCQEHQEHVDSQGHQETLGQTAGLGLKDLSVRKYRGPASLLPPVLRGRATVWFPQREVKLGVVARATL